MFLCSALYSVPTLKPIRREDGCLIHTQFHLSSNSDCMFPEVKFENIAIKRLLVSDHPQQGTLLDFRFYYKFLVSF
jgi:hypothetical protein